MSILETDVFNIRNFQPQVRLIPNVYFGNLPRFKLLTNVVINTDEGPYHFDVGTVFDGATVPWIARRVCPSLGMYLAATMIHDQACTIANDLGIYAHRKQGDRLFYSHLRQCGVSPWRAKPMSVAVIAYGKYLHATGKLS